MACRGNCNKIYEKCSVHGYVLVFPHDQISWQLHHVYPDNEFLLTNFSQDFSSTSVHFHPQYREATVA